MRNQSVCMICGKLVMDGEKIVGFPHFVYSEDDPLFFFSDGGFHEQCFMEHPDRDMVLVRLKEMYPDQFSKT